MKLGIRVKLVALVLLIILLVGGAITLYAIRQGRQNSRRTFEARQRELAALIASNTADDVYFLNVRALHQRINHVKLQHPQITYIYVADLNSLIFADTSESNSLRDRKVLAHSHNSPPRLDIQPAPPPGDVHVVCPVTMPDGSSIAALYVGFSSSDWSAALAQTTRASIWVTALCLVFGALLAVFLSTSFTRPIWKLVDATHAIRRRDFSRRVHLNRRDELGQLAESINEMAADLEKSTVSKSFMDGVFRSMIESLLVVRPDGVIASANHATAELLGYEDSELAGVHIESLFVQDPAEILLTHGADGEACRSDALVDLERLMVRKDGRQTAVCLSRSVMRSADGKIEGIVLVAQEITRRRAIELASHVEEVERARVAAEAANRSKSEFLANMSHEIRTPMTAILGYADMLLDPAQAPSDRVKCIETIRRNGRHLLAVINDILDISKIEAGKMLVERVPCQPAQIILDVASLLRARATEKGLSLDVEFAGPIPSSIRTDPTRLRQVLMNLVGNAVKFTEAGGVRLVVKMGGEGELRPRLRFEIIDTGVGMSPEQIENLFQPFTQGDTSTTRRFGGTGLGLAITSRLIKMLDGIIQVNSTPGHGTTFAIEIATGSLEGVQMITGAPSAAPPQSTTSTDAHPDSQDSPDSHPLHGIRVLLAEDGPDNRHLLTFLLTKAGATVDSVENGLLAVARALDAKNQAPPYDVILMDMQMPELDGYGAAARLRASGYTGPIIALTAHAMSGDREKCLEAGCDDYTPKPIDRIQLLSLIALHARNPLNAGPSSPAAPPPPAPAGLLVPSPAVPSMSRRPALAAR